MLKRWMMLFAVVALSLSLLAGCGASDDSPVDGIQEDPGGGILDPGPGDAPVDGPDEEPSNEDEPASDDEPAPAE